MDTAAAPSTPHTFAEMRRTRFADYAPNSRSVLEYLEQLASQTTTNIDDWDIASFINIPSEAKRDINKAFFAMKEKNAQGMDALTIAPQAALKEIEIQTSVLLKQQKEQIKAEIKSQWAQLDNYIRAGETHQRIIWTHTKNLYALEDRSPNYLVDELTALLKEGFWEFREYASGQIILTTRRDVVMSERNIPAKIDRRVNLGKYEARLNVTSMHLTLYRHLQNVVLSDYIYHPYCNKTGQICWGNGQMTASKLASEGKLHALFSLLASLLVTYSPEATPYRRLFEFGAQSRRYDRNQDIEDETPAEAEDICGQCDNHADECECCSNCHQYADGCDCCTFCDSTDRNTCGCCSECDRDQQTLNEEGHRQRCSMYELEEEEEEAAPPEFIPEPASVNESDIPF